MVCTGKQWDSCRVEKMGCTGCYYDEIEAGDYIRTERGYIFKVDKKKKVLAGVKFLDVQYGKIKKHSKNILDLIEIQDVVKVKDHDWIRIFNIDDEDILESFIEDCNENNWKLLSIVTKELFKSMEYKLENKNENI